MPGKSARKDRNLVPSTHVHIDSRNTILQKQSLYTYIS
jgi:hypothetical protein